MKRFAIVMIVLACSAFLLWSYFLSKSRRNVVAGPPSSATQSAQPRLSRPGEDRTATDVGRLGASIGGSSEPIANEEVLLPYPDVTLSDIHDVFTPHYGTKAGELLPPSLRPELEMAVFCQLHFAIHGDEESLRRLHDASSRFWWDQHLPGNYRVPREQVQQASEHIVGGPIRRVGFADYPFKVEKGRIETVLPPKETIPAKLKEKLQREYFIVTVYSVRKRTPSAADHGLYHQDQSVFVCDPDGTPPVFCEMRVTDGPPFEMPAVDVLKALRSQSPLTTK